MFLRLALVVSVSLLLVSAADWDLNHRKHLEKNPVFGLASLNVDHENSPTKYIYDAEITKDYTRFDDNMGYAFVAPGYYALTSDEYKIRIGMEGCIKTPDQKFKSSESNCLCFGPTKDPTYPNEHGECDTGSICLIPAQNSGKPAWRVRFTGESDYEALPECTAAEITRDKNDKDKMTISCIGQDAYQSLPGIKVTQEYILGKPYKVDMIKLSWKGCLSINYENMFFVGDLRRETETVEQYFGLDQVTEEMRGSACSKCSCKVDIDLNIKGLASAMDIKVSFLSLISGSFLMWFLQ